MGSENSWANELTKFLKTLGGGFLFGVPLLYTMEMWWIGNYVDLWKMLVFLVIAFLIGILMAFFGQTQKSQPNWFIQLWAGWDQATQGLAIGILGAGLVLLVLNRINLATPFSSVVGMIVIQAVPLTIGAAAANAIFQTGSGQSRSGKSGQNQRRRFWFAFLNDQGSTLAGAIFIGLPTAPSREIPKLSAGMDIWHILGLAALSLLITYVIVFVSGFDPRQGVGERSGIFQHPISETSLAYMVSLGVSFVALYLFGVITVQTPVYSALTEMIVLGFPASVGGAAGRIII